MLETNREKCLRLIRDRKRYNKLPWYDKVKITYFVCLFYKQNYSKYRLKMRDEFGLSLDTISVHMFMGKKIFYMPFLCNLKTLRIAEKVARTSDPWKEYHRLPMAYKIRQDNRKVDIQGV